jgi:hypothetical protein
MTTGVGGWRKLSLCPLKFEDAVKAIAKAKQEPKKASTPSRKLRISTS